MFAKETEFVRLLREGPPFSFAQPERRFSSLHRSSRRPSYVPSHSPESVEMNELPQLLDRFQNEVPGFVSTDVVEIESGMSIGGESIDPDFDSDMASASYAEVVKSNRRALDLLGMDPTTTEDILITTDDVYLLLRELGNEYYHGLAVARSSNLGMARMLMKKYDPMILEAIRG